jgi:hypothetical protein
VCRIIREDIRIKLVAQRCQWHRCACCVNDTSVHIIAVSLTPLCHQLCWLSSRIRSHIGKGFNLVYQGPRGSCLMKIKKKQRSKISCQGPFNYYLINMFCKTAPHEYKFIGLCKGEGNLAGVAISARYPGTSERGTKVYFVCQMCLDHSLPLNQRSDIPPPAYYCNECADKVITIFSIFWRKRKLQIWKYGK